MFGVVNDWMEMLKWHVLQWVQLRGRDRFKVYDGLRAEAGVEDLALVRWFSEN